MTATATATNTPEQLLAAYQGAVDAKYELVEGTPEWRLLDEVTDRLCFEYVVAAQAARHADHDTWPLVSEPGRVWCRTCQEHFGPMSR